MCGRNKKETVMYERAEVLRVDTRVLSIRTVRFSSLRGLG